MARHRVCMVVTDAVSFNYLCRGQLEYFRDNSDFELLLLCGDEQDELLRLVRRDVGEVIKIDIVRKPDPVRDLIALWQMVSFFSRRKFDLVIYSTPKAMLLAGLASFLTRQPVRIALFRGRVYENLAGWRRAAFALIDRLICWASHEVIFTAPSLRDAYVSEGIVPQSKTTVLGAGSSNGVDGRIFNPEAVAAVRGDIRVRLGYSAEDFLVVVVGRICVDKGIGEVKAVVALLESNRRVKFLLVGWVEGGEPAQIVEILLRAGAVAHLPHQVDPLPIFAAADLHLFLSHREGFGNVAIEAAACGVPTVGFDVVGVRDSVSAGVSGERFSFGDVVGIAAYIEQSACDKDVFRGRYSNASCWAQEHFDQAVVWRRYLDFYHSVLLVR